MPTDNVNPTAQYLVDQFKAAIEAGAPLASEAVATLADQVRMMGVAYSVLDLLYLVVAGFLLRAVSRHVAERDILDQNIAVVLGGGFGGVLLALVGTLGLRDDLLAAFAPHLWLIQQIGK